MFLLSSNLKKVNPRWTSQIVSRQLQDRYKDSQLPFPEPWHANLDHRKWVGDIETDQEYKKIKKGIRAWHVIDRDHDAAKNIALKRFHALISSSYS